MNRFTQKVKSYIGTLKEFLSDDGTKNDQGEFQRMIDKREQAIDILDYTIRISLTISIVMGLIFHFSGGEGSALQRSSYPFFLGVFCFLYK